MLEQNVDHGFFINSGHANEVWQTAFRQQYSLFGHFLVLTHLPRKVGMLRLFLDQDSGIKAACLSAFVEEVRTKRVDALYVRIAAELTADK